MRGDPLAAADPMDPNGERPQWLAEEQPHKVEWTASPLERDPGLPDWLASGGGSSRTTISGRIIATPGPADRPSWLAEYQPSKRDWSPARDRLEAELVRLARKAEEKRRRRRAWIGLQEAGEASPRVALDSSQASEMAEPETPYLRRAADFTSAAVSAAGEMWKRRATQRAQVAEARAKLEAQPRSAAPAPPQVGPSSPRVSGPAPPSWLAPPPALASAAPPAAPAFQPPPPAPPEKVAPPTPTAAAAPVVPEMAPPPSPPAPPTAPPPVEAIPAPVPPPTVAPAPAAPSTPAPPPVEEAAAEAPAVPPAPPSEVPITEIRPWPVRPPGAVRRRAPKPDVPAAPAAPAAEAAVPLPTAPREPEVQTPAPPAPPARQSVQLEVEELRRAKKPGLFGGSVALLGSMRKEIEHIQTRREREREAERRAILEAIRNLPDDGYKAMVLDIFRRDGYVILKAEDNVKHAIDLECQRHGERVFVQFRRRGELLLAEDPVREVQEAVAIGGADGGFVFADGSFTWGADELARQTGIVLVDGNVLVDLMEEMTMADAAQQTRQAKFFKALTGILGGK